MKITDINVRRFRYTSKIGRDSEGHAHPGNLELTGSLVSVETDDGVTGHCFGGDKDLVENVFRSRVVGRDPLHREFIWQDLAERTRRWNMDDRTLAAVDMALWDLAGKAAGMPVYKLIGAYRDKVKAYASTMVGDDIEGGLDTPETYADFAQRASSAATRRSRSTASTRPRRGRRIHAWTRRSAGRYASAWARTCRSCSTRTTTTTANRRSTSGARSRSSTSPGTRSR